MAAYFEQPVLLTILAVLPVLVTLNWRAGRRSRQSLRDLGILEPSVNRRLGNLLGWIAALTLLITAAAGPRWGNALPVATKPGCDVMLVVDVSRSMLTQDALPNRLERGKEAFQDLIDAVQARGGHRLGVVAFAGKAQVICPLTHDYDHVRSKVAALSADPLPASLASQETSGTRIGSGLAAAVAAHDPKSRGAQLIVLFSDGDDPANDGEWRTSLPSARSAGIPIHVVGIGDPTTESPIPRIEFRGQPVQSRMHEEPLREIAARTGGSLISGGTSKPDLADFVRETINRQPTRESVGGNATQWAPRQVWFLLPALGLVMWLLSAHFTWRPRIVTACIAMLMIAAAGDSDRELRRGLAALDAGQYERALTHFSIAGERTTDPGLVAFNEGIALFHLGRFREAELRFRWSLSDASGARRVHALYNLGCALLQQSQGRLAEQLRHAVIAFEQSLDGDEFDAEVRDQAIENLSLAKKLLAQLPIDSPKTSEQSNDSPADRPSTDSVREATTPGKANVTPHAVQVQRDGETDGSQSRITDRPPPPGKGSLPPLADDDALAPMTADDARAHLERAAARITAARNSQIRSQASSPALQFPDW